MRQTIEVNGRLSFTAMRQLVLGYILPIAEIENYRADNEFLLPTQYMQRNRRIRIIEPRLKFMNQDTFRHSEGSRISIH